MCAVLLIPGVNPIVVKYISYHKLDVTVISARILGEFAKLREAKFCLSVQMKQLGSQLTDFQEILHLSICLTNVEKMQVYLKSNNNDGHLTGTPVYFCVNL
jgi:hypothetical protein